MQDATKILLGTTQSSAKEVTSYKADPTTFVAGLAVRLKADGGLQIAADATAALIGVSLGPDLSDLTKTAVCRIGDRIPLILQTGFTTPVIGAPVYINETTGEACPSDNEDAVLTGAIYLSAPMVGVYPDKTGADVVLIDLAGGF